MRKSGIIIIVVLIMAIIGCTGVKPQKDTFWKLQNEANEMKAKGAIAVVGEAVGNADRDDMGKDAAYQVAFSKIGDARRVYVTNTSHRYASAIGVGKGSEQNDVLSRTIDGATTNLIENVTEWKYLSYQTKENKKAGTKKWACMLVISPDVLYRSIEDNLKKESSNRGSKENLYQRYMDSEAKKEHETNIKSFNESFGKK